MLKVWDPAQARNTHRVHTIFPHRKNNIQPEYFKSTAVYLPSPWIDVSQFLQPDFRRRLDVLVFRERTQFERRSIRRLYSRHFPYLPTLGRKGGCACSALRLSSREWIGR